MNRNFSKNELKHLEKGNETFRNGKRNISKKVQKQRFNEIATRYTDPMP